MDPAGNEATMTEGQRPPPTRAALKRRHKINPKRDVRPQVLTRANRFVGWGASLVVIAFLAIIAINALLA